MISFITLFLGLVLGVQTVSLEIRGPAASVVVELDGQVIGRLAEPPWVLSVDFGEDLAPHELVARALSPEGDELL